MVFRIFDNILATGVEALFGFGLAMLQKNEEKLLAMNFDGMALYLNNKIFDTYRVRLTHRFSSALSTLIHSYLRGRMVCMMSIHLSKTL